MVDHGYVSMGGLADLVIVIFYLLLKKYFLVQIMLSTPRHH